VRPAAHILHASGPKSTCRRASAALTHNRRHCYCQQLHDYYVEHYCVEPHPTDVLLAANRCKTYLNLTPIPPTSMPPRLGCPLAGPPWSAQLLPRVPQPLDELTGAGGSPQSLNMRGGGESHCPPPCGRPIVHPWATQPTAHVAAVHCDWRDPVATYSVSARSCPSDMTLWPSGRSLPHNDVMQC
jgi:hypothetical protein